MDKRKALREALERVSALQSAYERAVDRGIEHHRYDLLAALQAAQARVNALTRPVPAPQHDNQPF